MLSDTLTLAKTKFSQANYLKFEHLHNGGSIKPTASQDDQAYLCQLAILYDGDKDEIRARALSSERVNTPHKNHKANKHKWHSNANYLSRSIDKACKFVERTARSNADSSEFRTWQQVIRAIKSRKNPPDENAKHKALTFIAKRYLPHKHAEKLQEIGLQSYESDLVRVVHGQDILEKLSFSGSEWRGYTVQRLHSSELIQGKYLPDIALHGHNTLLIQSDLGTGKTELAGRIINGNAQENNQSVLIITPRRSLSISMSKRLNVNNYESIKAMPVESKEQREAKAQACERMACTINSVQDLVRDGFKYDVVIIDESELLALHLIGGAFDNKVTGLEHFYRLVGNAGLVLFLDAFLSPISAYLAAKCGREKHTTKVVVNPFHIWQSVNINWYEGDKDGESLAVENLFKSIADNQPTFVFSNSNEKISALHAEACEKHPNKNFILFNRENSSGSEQIEFLENPLLQSEIYDGVFCSPSVETGLSIDSERFKSVYGFFENTDSTGTATGAIQQLARCRKSTEWNVFCRNMTCDNPTDENDILEDIKASVINSISECSAVINQLIDVKAYVTPTIATELCCKVRAWENMQKNDFYKSLYALLTGFMGCTVNHVSGYSEVGARVLAHGKELSNDKYAQEIARAIDIDKSDYEQYTSDRKSKLFADNRIECERFELREFYRVDLVGSDVVRNGETVCTLSELLESDRKGKGIRKQIMALETATVATVDALRYGAANLLGNDFLNIVVREQTARIHRLPTQHRVRKLALAAIGIRDIDTVDWDNAPQWTASDIINSEFARYVSKNMKAVNAASVGAKFAADWLTNGKACFYFSSVLKSMGFDVYQLSQVSAPAPAQKMAQCSEVLSISDNSETLCHKKTANTLNTLKTKTKRDRTRIYTLGKVREFCFFQFRKNDGVNWIADRIKNQSIYDQAKNNVARTEEVINQLTSIVEAIEHGDSFADTSDLTGCMSYVASFAEKNTRVQAMYSDVIQTLDNIECNSKQHATRQMFIDCCNSYISIIKPVPVIPEHAIKAIKRLQKTPKGLQLVSLVARVFGKVDAQSINEALSITDQLVAIGALKIEHAQDKLKSVIKLVDISPVYSFFCGVVI